MFHKNKNYNKLILVLLVVFGCLLYWPAQLQAKVEDYKVTNFYTKDSSGNIYLVTREFQVNNQQKLFAINTKNFGTIILDANTVTTINPKKQQQIDNIFKLQPLKEGNNKKVIYLTVDLCPSSKHIFEENFFEKLITYGRVYKRPINIAISLTATWAIKHPKELNMLKKWNKDKDLNITWVNHSYSHFYNPKLPKEQNFMLHDIKNAQPEIINNEIYMLNNGIIPSIFFRFPGLIYNYKLLNEVQELHLVALDTNAWLAKTRGIFKPGSIILVHGNGNEHIGIKLFLALLNRGTFNNYEFAPINSILVSKKY